MNLFIFDEDHSKNASWHCDAHVRKLILESAQMLCTAINVNGGNAPYKSTHVNHPVCKWVREYQKNYWWTYEYGMSLCREYRYRFGKIHKTENVIDWCGYAGNYPRIDYLDIISPFVLAMPDQYKSKCPFTSYRQYFTAEKRHIAKWTKRDIPEWYK